WLSSVPRAAYGAGRCVPDLYADALPVPGDDEKAAAGHLWQAHIPAPPWLVAFAASGVPARLISAGGAQWPAPGRVSGNETYFHTFSAGRYRSMLHPDIGHTGHRASGGL